MDGFEGSQEGLLSEILGNVDIVDHVEHVPVDATNVALVQLAEGLAVSGCRPVNEDLVL